MSRAGYGFIKSCMLGKNSLSITGERRRELNKTQKKLKKHGYGVNLAKVGLGFTATTPVKISIKGKKEGQYPSVQVMKEKEKSKLIPRTSVFDR